MLIVPSVTMEEFVFCDAKHIAPLFLLLVVALYPLRLLIDSFWPNFNPQLYPIIQSSSFLNRVFAGHCFEIYLILFILICYLKISKVNSSILNIDTSIATNRANSIPLRPLSKTDKLLKKLISPTPTPISQKEVNKKLIFIQVYKLFLIYIPLTILLISTLITNSSLFELIQKWTGGECTDPNFEHYRSCLVSGSKYIGGFKVSGHCLITSTFSLFLIWEGIMWKVWYGSIKSPLGLIFTCIMAFIVVCWVTLFTITCLFYHTFLERLTGTLIGTSIFFICYIYLSL